MLIILHLSLALCSGRLASYEQIHLLGFHGWLVSTWLQPGSGIDQRWESKTERMGYHCTRQWMCPSKATPVARQPLPKAPAIPGRWEPHCLLLALSHGGVAPHCSCWSSVSQHPVLVLLTVPTPQLIIPSLKFLHLYHLSGISSIWPWLREWRKKRKRVSSSFPACRSRWQDFRQALYVSNNC